MTAPGLLVGITSGLALAAMAAAVLVAPPVLLLRGLAALRAGRTLAGMAMVALGSGALVASATFVHAALLSEPTPPVPAILAGFEAAGGSYPACPGREASPAGAHKPVGSSALGERLGRDYPVRSSEGLLVADLVRNGFRPSEPCGPGSTVHAATFRQRGGSLTRFPMQTTVHWEAEGGRIVGVGAAVSYLGP